ncbi:hypothetical protein [Streptomyces sp. CB02923]|uniref:hypothetical protein n=1 Tax=Streptomyces sp. CB02923 TaxID=1718985 RepID=UPI001901E49A|nr:hypothetical protein [Streptomyces sp. CB02923]
MTISRMLVRTVVRGGLLYGVNGAKDRHRVPYQCCALLMRSPKLLVRGPSDVPVAG